MKVAYTENEYHALRTHYTPRSLNTEKRAMTRIYYRLYFGSSPTYLTWALCPGFVLVRFCVTLQEDQVHKVVVQCYENRAYVMKM